MESDLDRGVRAWSARIVRAYADATHGPITPETEASIARVLRGPMADCVELAEPAMVLARTSGPAPTFFSEPVFTITMNAVRFERLRSASSARMAPIPPAAIRRGAQRRRR